MPHQKRKRSGSLHRHDHTNQTTPKRRRLGSSASRTQHRTPPSAIQRETTSTDNVSISGHSSAQPERKLKRRRPKTAGIRRELCQGIEKLLRMDPSPIGHLFASCDEEGAPQAEFEEVLKFLNIDMEKLSNLSHQVICSISNETDIFCVDQNSDTGKLFVKFYPLTFDPDDATVYVDNLPDGANSEKLRRLADLFGNVVSVKLPLKPPRWVQTPRGRADMGSKPQKFGFIQFTHSDSVDQFRKVVNLFIRAYNKNFPLEARRKNSETASHQLAMETLKKKIRILARKRYRRNLHESLKLSRLRRVFASMRKKELQLAKKEKQKINGLTLFMFQEK
ncbi:hypothetical protein WR25_10542 isoform B [Diploscapter pachys]|uniref:RRM domain-containing protein n=1 Tax=Diploscapter pachys TaxID=2018661 RepID=A0A2A2LUQ9_9BILA|nr:hypothetical protein WR25_10542 isoform A [Diploscapter pachys]PAV89964.1 hypothetical protein WR25_10542 isoform B [Diploscapter pachys]